jgi:hypothetical protein
MSESTNTSTHLDEVHLPSSTNESSLRVELELNETTTGAGIPNPSFPPHTIWLPATALSTSSHTLGLKLISLSLSRPPNKIHSTTVCDFGSSEEGVERHAASDPDLRMNGTDLDSPPPPTPAAVRRPVAETTLDLLDAGVGDGWRSTAEVFAEGTTDEDVDDVRDPVGDGPAGGVAEAERDPKL